MHLRATRTRLSILATILLTATVMQTSVAQASPISDKVAQAKQLQAEIDANGAKIAALGEQYDGAVYHLQQVQAAIGKARSQLAEAQREAAAIKHRVAGRAASLYMQAGNRSPLQAVDVNDVVDLGSRAKYSSAAASSDDVLIGKLTVAQENLRTKREQLDRQLSDAQAAKDRIDASRQQVEAANAQQQQLLSQVKGELKVLIEKEQQRLAAKAKAEAEARAAAAAAAAAARSSAPATDRASGPGLSPDSPIPNLPASPRASVAIAFARAQLGKPYVYAAAGPDAYDCSGLTMRAWEAAGVSMPHYSGAQYAMFPHVPIDQAQPGDLMFEGPGGSQHVAMYLGGGMWIAATHTGDYVRIQPVPYASLTGAVRPG